MPGLDRPEPAASPKRKGIFFFLVVHGNSSVQIVTFYFYFSPPLSL